MKNIDIILPERIPILREQPKQDLKVKDEEFSLYYKNFITPLYPWYDVVIECEYGKNYGFCWRIKNYPESISEFPLTVKVYDAEGTLVGEKSVVIELFDQSVTKPFKILCVGDSQTHHSIYVAHMQNRLYNVFTVGTRSFDGHVFFEGRGGWRYSQYFEKHTLNENERGACKWVSPFLFPEGVNGRDYFGDMEFYEASQEKDRSTITFNGFVLEPIKDGQYYNKHGKLYRYPEKEPVSETVKWEFDFKKYLEKNNITGLNAVSVLLGANDLYPDRYEDVDSIVAEYIKNAKRFIAAVKAADKNIDVIINLPICASEQIGWAERGGCSGSSKMYSYSIRKGAKALIDEFENTDGVYICPTMCSFDAENNYPVTTMRVNLYNDRLIERKDDNVHPSPDGYRQMGDTLSAMVEKLRHKKN